MGEVMEGLLEKKKHKKRKHGVDELVVDVGMNVTLADGDKSKLRSDGKKDKNKSNEADNAAAATDAASVEKQIGDEVTEKLHFVKKKKRKEKLYGDDKPGNKDDVLEVTDKVEGHKKKKKKNSGTGLSVEDQINEGTTEQVESVKDNAAAATDAASVEKQIVDEATKKLHSVKNKKRKEKVYGVNENDEPIKRTSQDDVLGVTDKVEGHKKKKKKNSGAGLLVEDQIKNGTTEQAGSVKDNAAAATDTASIEKVIGDEATGKLHSVKNKKRKQKEKVYGVNENDGPTKRTSQDDVLGVTDKVEGHKKKKRKNSGDQINNGITEQVESVKDTRRTKKKEGDLGDADGKGSQDGASKKRKKNSLATGENVNADAGSVTNEADVPTDPFETSNASKKSKKVKFNDNVEVFSLLDDSSQRKKNTEDGSKKKNSEDGLLQGKRFSKEEDEIIRKAVLQYIEDHQLGEEGLNMVLKCSQHKELKDCWKEIAEALPLRNKTAIYRRAHILFERNESRKWTKEELEVVRKYHQKYGPKWRQLADEIGRNRVHVKDAYRQVKLANKKNGQWSQEEYQNLFNLVNKDLRIRAFMDRKSKHGMLRDNIGWEAISEELTTRTDPVCCVKWYNQLSSKLVACGLWADTDDYRLLMALVDVDATCEEDVDWDDLVEERSGSVCRKRWSEMVRHTGKHGMKPFSEQVEILSQRYCEDVLEVRETYDNKPFVD